VATLDRPEVGYRTPVDLVAEVLRGRIRIPPFQRGFKWESGDVIDLFDSLIRGFPIGNLLLWRQPAKAAHLQVGPVEVDAPETGSALWVVDGQQRITSLVGALVAAEDATDARFRIYLDLDHGSFHSLGVRQQPEASWVAVSRLLDTSALLRWMRENAGWLSDEQIAVADRAAKAIREYQIPTYVVSSPEEASLVEIFRRMNDTGKPLTKAEVFHALHSGLSGDEPADLRSVGAVTAQLGFGTLDDRLVLRCVLAFRGGDIFREDFRDEFTSDIDRAETFREVAGALREVVAFLAGEAGVPHVRLLPYSHVLPILVRFVRVHGAPSGRTAALLRRWVWRGAIAGTRARGISVVDIRHQVSAADMAEPLESARNLLRQVPSFPEIGADLNKVHFNHAMTKINVLGLLSAQPRDPRTKQPVDVVRLLQRGSPLRSIVNDEQLRLSQTLANRAVTDMGSGRVLRRALVEAGPEVAASHLIDDTAFILLVSLQFEEFLVRRELAVRAAVKRHIDRMAEWGARDGRSVADVIRSVA
jgi:hypothetical protein